MSTCTSRWLRTYFPIQLPQRRVVGNKCEKESCESANCIMIIQSEANEETDRRSGPEGDRRNNKIAQRSGRENGRRSE